MDQSAFRILGNEPDVPELPKQKKGGFLSGLLPTLFGAAGGILGGIGGTFVAPGAGTVGGAAAGGAGGSALGEWLRQQITGDQEAGGGAVAREALFGAIPGVGGGATKLARGGLAALKGAKAAKTAAKGADILSENAVQDLISEPQKNAQLGKNLLTLLGNQQGRKEAAGSNIASLLSNARGAENAQFNRLALENIQRLANEPRAITLPGTSPINVTSGGAMDILRRPNIQSQITGTPPQTFTRGGSLPSLAGEGVELQGVPAQRGLTSFRGQPLTPSARPNAQEILQPQAAIPTPAPQQAVEDIVAQTQSSPLARQAERLFGRQTGIMPGAKADSSILDAPGMPKAAELKAHIKNNIGGKPTDNAHTVFSRNNAYIDKTRAQLAEVFNKAKDVDVGKNFSTVILNKIKKPVGVDLSTSQVYKDLINDLPRIKGIKAAQEYKVQLDDVINYNRPGVDPKEERVARAARRAINEFIGEKLPQTKQLNKSLSTAYDVQKFTRKSAVEPPNAARPFGIPVPGSARVQQSMSGLGARALEILGGGTRTPVTAGAAPGLGRQFLRGSMAQGATRLGGAALLGTPLVGGSAPAEAGAGELPMDLASLLGGEQGGEVAPEQQTSEQLDPETINQLFQSIALEALARGDDKTVDNLSKISKIFEAQQKQQGQSAEIQKKQQKASDANSIINELENVFAQAGGARGPIAGRATLIGAAAGGGNQVAKAYQELRSAYTAQISRALGEVGVLTDKDREVIQQAIPSINDSPEAKDIKIATLRNILADVSGRQSGSNQASSDEDINAILQELGML